MGCGSCGTTTGGKPSGCKSNGGCSTGGCNRLNVYNWLSELPLHDGAKPYQIVEVSFSKGSRKEFFRNNTNYILEKNDWITVEGVGGIDVGQVSLTGELVKLQMKKYGVSENSITKRILHPSTDDELSYSKAQKEREQEILIRSRVISKSLNLDMKLCEVEVQADGKKGTFFYTADQRVDFRELIKLYAGDFRMKIEMRQIGARQESAKVGGIGSCGRELCCSTWLSDFKSVNTTAARYQNLSINQAKLSGQCGRLKCCLNYELDTYLDALSVFPDHADHLETQKGVAHLQKRDIFKNLMWYSYSDNNKQYPLSITRVKEILKLNKQGQKADELQPVELEIKTDKQGNVKTEVGFVNDVGQISLKNLEKNNKKKKPGNKPVGREREREKPAVTENGERPQQQARPPRQGGGGNPQNPRQQRPPNNPGTPKPQNERKQPAEKIDGSPDATPARQQRPQQPRPQNRPEKEKGPQEAQQTNRPKPNNRHRNDRPRNDRKQEKGDKPEGQSTPASPEA